MTHKQIMVIWSWLFTEIFSKMNKISLLFEGKQLTVIAANDKSPVFQEILEL